MDSSRKQFKSLSMAQPIKKDINQTLAKLQNEKRKYLSLQREQANLKQELQKIRRQLNEVKLLEPKIRVKQNKNVQTNISINNTDRLYLSNLNKISELKIKIDVHRRQIEKYKRLTKEINKDFDKIKEENDSFESNLLKKQQKNQNIKTHLLEYRTLNMRNTDEFKSSFSALQRSESREENSRRKNQALRKSFNVFQDLKSSNAIKLVDIQEQHSSLQEVNQLNPNDLYMTNCIPLVKERIRNIIHNNKQRIKISENYKKFGEQLENMFNIMKEYKGRDDVGFIADQFVMKEKQLKKIEQYIGKLENRLMWYKSQLQKIKRSDFQLIQELKQEENLESKVEDNNYIKLQNQVKKSIQKLKLKEQENSAWFESIGHILAPLVDEEIINRTDIDKILGQIQDNYMGDQKTIKLINEDKNPNRSPSKAALLNIDDKQLKVAPSFQLMTYEKLKQYAKDYIALKK